MGYPSERGADEWRRYDYDYFQSELAAAEGIRLGESAAGSGPADPSLLAVLYDYVKLMPMMAEANQMSQELAKVTLTCPNEAEGRSTVGVIGSLRTPVNLSTLQGVEFSLEIKNLALSDSKGHDLEKTIVVKVTAAQRKQVGPPALPARFLLFSSPAFSTVQPDRLLLDLPRCGCGPRPSLSTANS